MPIPMTIPEYLRDVQQGVIWNHVRDYSFVRDGTYAMHLICSSPRVNNLSCFLSGESLSYTV
jgi:hypothetical protein